MATIVSPDVFVLAYTQLNNGPLPGLKEYLAAIGCPEWETDGKDGDMVAEIAGRACYRSFAPGLNPNVTKVREGNATYLANILAQKHGAVLEHASATFAFVNTSRVLTHELVRHRAGVAISQESMRYVRYEDIPMVLPEEFTDDDELMGKVDAILTDTEALMAWISRRFKLDDPATGFHTKKTITSAMRRLIPHGVATSIIWTANIRALRHVVEIRTAMGAEYEIREAFNQVGMYASALFPNSFHDFSVSEDGEWIAGASKV